MKLQTHRLITTALLVIAIPVLMVTSGCKSAKRNQSLASMDREVDQTITPESLQPSIAGDMSAPHQTMQPGKDAVDVSLVSSERSADGAIAGAITQAAITAPPAAPTFPTLHTLQSGENINEMIQAAPGTVLVDFYADWCGPCKIQGKVLHSVEEFASQNQARIIKVDIEKHKSLAKQLNVTTLPTLMVIKDGKVVDRRVGLNQEPQIRKMLQ